MCFERLGQGDFARPLEGWDLPQCFGILRRRLEADHGSEGSKEYIAVLRLLENHPLARLKVAVNAALELGCARRELIEQYLYGDNRKASTFLLDGHQHLKQVKVKCTDPGDYTSLLSEPGKEVVA